MDVSNTVGVPIFNWCDGVEDGAWIQATNLAQLPFAFHHVALMPDAHQGYGMPIGGVLAALGAVVPNAVGLDIGCGVNVWETGLRAEDVELDAFMQEMRERVPVGFHWHAEPRVMWGLEETGESIPVIKDQLTKASMQMGTLGGGNHFIEADADEEGRLYILVHSGSRNVGKLTAEYHADIARSLNELWFSQVETSWELDFLPLGTDEANAYLKGLEWCLEFARMNRIEMIEQAEKALHQYNPLLTEYYITDVHHNYAALEHHFGKNVMVHRKGAVRARAEEKVVIPGSMGSASYLGAGLGNLQSFQTCSHGAGRAMGRKAAIRSLDAEAAALEMKERGIRLYGGGRGNDWVAESREAYKDIDKVMDAQADLVEIETKLTPLAVMKG